MRTAQNKIFLKIEDYEWFIIAYDRFKFIEDKK